METSNFGFYVVLKPDAREILGKSQQFQRKGDNTIFHKGYSINYRGSGGRAVHPGLHRT